MTGEHGHSRHTADTRRTHGGHTSRAAGPDGTTDILPVFRLGGAVSLSAVLEPVANLRRRQPRSLGKLPLLPRGGIRVVRVPLAQHRARLLLEAVARLLAVPDGAGERELPPHAVLPDGAERSASQLLRLEVVRLQPQRLQLRVVVRRERVALEDLIQLLEVAAVEGDDGLRLQHALVLVKVLAGGQRPEEAGEALDVAAVL